MIYKVVHVSSSLQMGGAENSLFQLVRGLQPRVKQEVICFKAGPFVERIRALGVPVHVVTGACCSYDFVFLWRLWRIFKKTKPDIIHAQLWLANFFARCYGKLCRIPVVCAIHSPLNQNSKNTWLRSMLDRYTLRWADKIIFVAHHLASSTAITRLVPAHRTVIIENGVDPHYLHARAQISRVPREAYEFCANHFVLGTVGRLVDVKNHRVLIDLLARLHVQEPKIRLLIIGDGPLKESLLAYARERGVFAYMKIISAVALEYYELFDVFLLPSHAEGLSLALLEAMSFMVPVIVAPQAGAGVIDHQKNGYVTTFFTPSVDAVIVDLMHDDKLRYALGRAGYQTVLERFSWQTMVHSYEALFLRIKKQEFDF